MWVRFSILTTERITELTEDATEVMECRLNEAAGAADAARA
jgi:hypothetical protein